MKKKGVDLSLRFELDRQPSSVRTIELIPKGSPEETFDKVERALRIMCEAGDDMLPISQDGWLR